MKKVSVPWRIYFILFIIALIFLIPYNVMLGNKSGLWNAFCNVGYGIIGSLIVAVLIDYANTNEKRKNDIEKLHIISTEYRVAFLNLRDSVLNVAELRYGLDGKKRDFNGWIDYVLAPLDEQQGETDENVFDSLFDIQFRVEKIEKAATILFETLLLNLDNGAITNEYRQNVKSVRSLSAHISKLLQDGNYEVASKAIKERLIPKFLKNNEEWQLLFVEPYCEDRYTED